MDEYIKTLRKLSAEPRGEESEPKLLAIIMHVNEPGYVPEGVKVRARIGPFIFTAEAEAGTLAILEGDARVTSVSLGQKTHIIK